MRKTGQAFAGFEDEIKPWPKECRQLPEAGIGKETDSPQGSSEKWSPAIIFILEQWDPFCIPNIQDCKIIYTFVLF